MGMKIVIPEIIDITFAKYVNKLHKFGEVKYYQDFPKDNTELINRIRGADIVICKWVDFNGTILEKCNNLKEIVTLTSGFAHFPLKMARERGINIINCPTHNSLAVAEHVMALMFAVSRKIVEAQVNLQKGLWRETTYSYQGTELSGKILGIIGLGHIGKILAGIAKGLGMKVIYVNSKSSSEDLTNLIKNSDYISINVPKTDETYHMIDRKSFEMMKSTAILINTARGEVVDQKELYNALREKVIAGAGLDVFENTVAIGKAPDDIVEISKLPNVVTTPHIAFNTKESAERMGEEMIKNIKAIINNKPINIVN